MPDRVINGDTNGGFGDGNSFRISVLAGRIGLVLSLTVAAGILARSSSSGDGEADVGFALVSEVEGTL